MVTDDRFADCAPLARLLLYGMLGLADRAGRLEDRPRRIAAEALPYDRVDVDPLLDELAANGLIDRYEATGQRVIQIRDFLTHQTPHHREPDSKLPAKTESPGSATARPRRARGKAQAQPKPCPPYPVLDPVPDPVLDPVLSPSSSAFEQFWNAYPKKVGRGAAERKFASINPDEDLLATMLDAIDAQSRSRQWREEDGRYIPHPSTWLNQRRWEDEQPDHVTAPARVDWYADCQHQPKCATAAAHDLMLAIDEDRREKRLPSTSRGSSDLEQTARAFHASAAAFDARDEASACPAVKGA